MKYIENKTNITNSISRINRNKLWLTNRNELTLVTSKVSILDKGYKHILTSDSKYKGKNDNNIIYFDKDILDEFNHNDIIQINKDGINFLWEFANNSDNCFFLTESCSCRCIMCPQPPAKHNTQLEENVKTVLNLIPKDYKGGICITGGEPTLIKDFYLKLLKI